ncbi:hypothetical protein FRB94_002263 [Tulasnella sp. JGI-2019a]|nr:hypothetical protein FRB93_004073 [Tulasnella sp. JGI-2019a]KAG9004587.1 hypothetical protein FRB94_002263 [Tulasnella sp. JGI-2019a]KAG9031145.1 hypothetical protein FRB95_003119 [Tulasnella sp. JGI-2019a]
MSGEEKINEAVRLLTEAAREVSLLRIDGGTGEWQKEDLDTCLQRLTTKVRDVMIQHSRSRNRSCPLYRLPLEILVQVLLLALQDVHPDPPIYMKRLRIFTSVSYQWLRLVMETPSFWRTVSSDLPLPLLLQVLSRSAGHSLDVVYSKTRHDNIPRNQFTTLVVEHAHRWHSLIVQEDMFDQKAAETFQSLVPLSAPALEVLTCCGGDGLAVELFSRGASRLRHVKLNGTCVPWESTLLSNLQTLHLENLGKSIPSGVQLLAILATSPGLVELRVENCYSLYHYSTPLQMMPVSLPMLQTLSIRMIPQHLTHDLLTAIRVPRCTSFSISYKQESDFDLGLFNNPDLAHITSPLIAYIRLSLLITIAWSGRSAWIDLSTSTGTVTLNFGRFEDAWYAALPAGLSDALEEAESSEIHLDFCRRADPIALLTLLGPSQCRVTKIHMNDQEEYGITGLMRFLAKPIMVDGRAQWPLPSLRHLAIVDSDLIWELLVEVVLRASRYKGVDGSRQEGMSFCVLEPCVPFHLAIQDRLDRGSVTEEDVDTVRQVLGESNFSYRLAFY